MTDTAATLIPLEVLQLPKRGENTAKGEESRVPDAASARCLVSVALREDQGRSAMRAVVKGLFDGNPPLSQSRLNEKGMGWCANLNWLGLEGRIDGARVPYYSLFAGVPTYITACAYDEQESPDRARWEQVYAQKWTDVHNKWRQFKWHIQEQQFWMLYEGWGPAIREDDSDWRFRSVPTRSVLVPQGAPSCIDKRLPWIAVRIPYRAHELFDKIRNEKAAKDAGWDVQAVQDAIKYNTKGSGGYPYREQQWEVWQQKYKNKELEASYTDCDLIYTNHLYVQEYSGKVSHFIFVEESGFTSKATADRFLFSRKHRYDSYDQVIHVAWQNTGDGTWHSVRGMGVKAYKHEDTMNRMQCRIVDNVFLSSGLTIQAGDQRSTERRQLVVNQGVTWIPAGTNVVDRPSIAGQLEQALGVYRHMDNQLSQKLGNFQQRSLGRDDGRGEQPTATQVQFAAAKESSLSNGQQDNYYLDLDTLYIESNRRLLKSSDPDAVWFRDQCQRAGIPEKVMMSMQVKANRVSGYGSPGMRDMAIQKMTPFVGMLNPEGKNNFLNEVISTAAGPDKIRLWNPPIPQPDIDDWMIQQENATISDGVMPVILSGQSHVRHLEGHLAYGEEKLAPVAQMMEAGQDDPAALQEAVQFMAVFGPHCDEHLAALKADPSEKGNYQLFETKLKNLAGFNGKLYQALRRAQNMAKQAALEQQQAQVLGVLDQAKLQSMNAEMERESAKAAHDMELKDIKTRHAQELKTWQASQRNKLDAAKTANQVNLNTAKTISDIRLNGKRAEMSESSE